MCGIVGVFERRGDSPDRRMLDAMTDRLRHRGPDGRGTYVHEGVGFGHRRLSIIGLADGAQPMTNEDGTVWVTFNGEIYNYLELRRELEALGHVFRTHSDTEVLLHGFESWGEDLVLRLRGIFAFALHDQRARAVFAARDHLGVKPFYYHLSPERFVFASEPKALFLHPGVPHRPGLDGLALYLRYGFFPSRFSAFDGVVQLEPGSALMVHEDDARLRRYWVPPAIGRGGPARRHAELIAELGARVDETVEAELMSEVPLGAFLSGGVDSSTVAASMAHSARLGQRPRTFCIGFDEPDYDESAHSRRVAEHLGLDHTVEIVSIKDLDLLETLVDVYDEPFADSSALPTYALCKMARRHVTVALSGDGGDEVFAGYRRYKKLAAHVELPQPFRRAVLELSRRYPAELPGSGTLRALALEDAARYDQELSFPPNLLGSVVSRELVTRSVGWSITELFENAPGETLVEKAEWCDLVAYLPADILTKVDRASMAHGLEVRVPLLDHRFVEWSTALPRALSFGDGEGKVALKAHLATRVPRALFQRPKMGFGVPLEYWLGGDDGLAVLAARLKGRRSGGGFAAPIDAKAFEALLSSRSRHDQSGVIFALLFLEAWWQRHFG